METFYLVIRVVRTSVVVVVVGPLVAVVVTASLVVVVVVLLLLHSPKEGLRGRGVGGCNDGGESCEEGGWLMEQ